MSEPPKEPGYLLAIPPRAQSTALAVFTPGKLPVPLQSPKELASEVMNWRNLPVAERTAMRPEIEALIVDHDDKAEANKSRALMSTIVVSSIGGGLTVAGTGAIVTTLVAGGAITVLVAAPVAVGAATLLGGLCLVGYFYSTARKQAKTGKLLGIMLKEGDRPSDGSAKD